MSCKNILNKVTQILVFKFHLNKNKEIKPIYKGVSIANTSLISIGERVSFGGQVRIHNTTNVSIGNDCMIAFGVQILTATHDYHNHPMWKERVDRPVDIGNHVWIGANAIILPGVKIGDYAVVGAGTVVTSHVPAKAVVIGSPARIINYRDIGEIDKACTYPGIAVTKDFIPNSKVIKSKFEK